MSDWWQNLLLRLDYQDPVVLTPAEVPDRSRWDALRSLGLLTEALPATRPWCPECGDEATEIGTLPMNEAGKLYLCCPTCGLVPTVAVALQRWQLHLDRLLQFVRASLALRGALTELVPRRIWQLGRRTQEGTSRACLLLHGLQRRDAAEILQSANLPPHAIYLVPARLPAARVAARLHSPMIVLADILGWRAAALTCEAAAIDDCFVANRHAPTKRTPPKRAERAAAIEAIKEQLVEHLRAARSHAQASLDHQGVALLLPRPTQKELAKLVGLSEVAVCRCLRDPAARELQLLWNTAHDLEAMLR